MPPRLLPPRPRDQLSRHSISTMAESIFRLSAPRYQVEQKPSAPVARTSGRPAEERRFLQPLESVSEISLSIQPRATTALVGTSQLSMAICKSRTQPAVLTAWQARQV